MENGWANEDPRVILAVLIGIAAAICGCIMTHRKKVTRKKQKQLAIEAGRVITAKRVKFWRDVDYSESGGQEITHHGTYEYIVDGKVRHYRLLSKNALPFIINLYYNDSPRKVFSGYDYMPQTGYSLAILSGIAACVATMWLTGYFS